MVKKNKEKTSGYISLNAKDRYIDIKEEFSGMSFDTESMFPKGLGAKHPFDFESIEKLYKKYGIISGIINKITDSIVGDFDIQLDNENAKALVDSFVHSSNFKLVLREWVREGLLKGNGFIELDLDDEKIRILNANFMYVKRNKKGKVLEYNQWTKPFKGFRRDSPDMIPFKPNKIAHLLINKIPNDPYGIGIVWQNERVIQNLILNEQDLQKLVSRKAGSPYHFKVGQPGVNVPTNVVDDVNAKLQYLTNRTEWVTDADIDIKAISFPDLGKNLTEAQMYFFRMLLAGVEMPEVMMGSGQLNEGIAKAQVSTFKLKIAAYRDQISTVIEEKIIRPLLRANNLDEQPKFIWELPTEEDINDRILRIKELLGVMPSAAMKAGLEIELANLLGLEDLEKVLPTPEEAKEQEALDREREQEENIPQPEVPGAKPRANEDIELNLFEIPEGEIITEAKGYDQEEDVKDITIKDWVNVKEIAGFNYTDYLISILKVIDLDEFSDLAGITEEDIINGLLTETQIKKLKVILKDGFKENLTIKELEKQLESNIRFKDRITTSGVILAENRVNMIARTETVRLSNEGLINLYKENKIKKVRWLAALSGRTCPECESLNGRVFNINEAIQPPLHVNCRCTLLSVIE